MGTSSMYTGPSGSPLLPDDFEDTSSPDSNENPQEPDRGNNEDNETEETPSGDNQNDYENEKDSGQQNLDNNEKDWSNAKKHMSKYASGTSLNYKKAVSSYVKAHGGAKNAAKSATSGIKTTSGLGQFLSNSSSHGVRDTLSQYHIEYEGRSAKDILSDIINHIAPVPVTKEDSVARKALIRTMEVLYEKIDDDNNDITTLEKIDKEILNEMIPIQVESYIYERIINDLGSRIESNSTSPANAISKEKEIKEYINSKVGTTLKDRDFSELDFNQKINSEVENLYKQCYKVMEDIL
jgi:hypothetical protein